MKILQVHNRYRSSSPGGEDRVVDQEHAALVERGHTVERFERYNDDIEHFSGRRSLRIPLDVVWNDPARRSLKRHIERFRPQIVHLHNTFPLLSASVLHACRSEGVPVVVTLHNYRLACAPGEFFRDDHPCFECLGRSQVPAVRHGCYQSSIRTIPVVLGSTLNMRAWRSIPSAYIFISQAERDLLAHLRFPPERSFVKDNLVPAAVVPRGKTTTKPLIAYAGRLTPAKGVRLLMQAWDRYLADPDPGLRLAIAGTGPLDAEVQAWAATRPSVDVLGMLGRKDCARLVASARAAVVPSTWPETFGLVAIEAMACAVPPIAPDNGSFPGLITDGYDGILFDSGNADALAKVFLDAELDPERWQACGRHARATYEKRFDPDRSMQQLLDIYDFARAHKRQERT